MRFQFKAPDLSKVLKETEQDIEKSVTNAMREVTETLKQDLREDVIAGGLGPRLARTWRGKTFPERTESLNAASFVWSKAAKLADAFDRGALIKSRDGFFLAIPTAAAGPTGRSANGRSERITPGGWERRTGLRLRFVYRRGAPSLLVADQSRLNSKGLAAANRRKRGDTSIPIFILVPQAKLKKRLNIEKIAEETADRVPAILTKHWRLS
jgi:hypothetical protein